MNRVKAGAVVSALVIVSCLCTSGALAAPESEGPATLRLASIPRCESPEAETGVGDSQSVSLKCKGLNKAAAEIVSGPRHGELGKVSQKRDRVTYRPDDGYSGPDHSIVEREEGGSSFRSSIRLEVGRVRGLDCEDHHVIARSNSAVEVHVHCDGKGLGRLELEREPNSGELDKIRHLKDGGERTLVARYTPEDGFAGQDAVVVEASAGHQSTLGSIGVSVLPWRMRAMGDSVTAGFGFMSDGTPMTSAQLFDCRPPDQVNNRCSSNSDNDPDFTGPAGWSADFGLKNDISWAAQFANSITPHGNRVTAPDDFQNLAVTGSAPTDWLTGGAFNPQLKAIIKEDPELVAMTLGANPLLSNILFGNGTSCASQSTVAGLRTASARSSRRST